jgi:hypothetical protein
MAGAIGAIAGTILLGGQDIVTTIGCTIIILVILIVLLIVLNKRMKGKENN